MWTCRIGEGGNRLGSGDGLDSDGKALEGKRG